MYTINIKNSRINIIRQLLQFEGKSNQTASWFKKTSNSFKKKYGFDLIGAPIIFKANGMIYKLSFIQGNYSSRLGGRKWERAEYQPFVEVGDKFSRLELKK